MDQQTLYILLFAVILLAAVIVIVFMMNHANLKQQIAIRKMLNESEKAKDDEMDEFRTQVSQQMMNFQNGMSESIRSDLNRLNESTTSRLNRIETSVNDSLLKGFEKTNQSFTSIKEQMARIDETQQSLKNLSTSIAGLQNVLTDKKIAKEKRDLPLLCAGNEVYFACGLTISEHVKVTPDTREILHIICNRGTRD